MSTSFAKLTTLELRNVLKKKGIGAGKKNKRELVDLVVATEHLYSDLEECDHQQSEKKRKLVQDNTGNLLDLSTRKVHWSRNLKTLPDIREGDAFAYFINVCEWPPNRLSSYKNQDGFKMFKDQHVEDVEIGHHEDTDTAATEFLYVRGKVKPEQRQTAQRYNTWLLLTTSGEVKSGGCQCVSADAGNCKHVVCLLFALADYNTRRIDKATEVGTDKLCLWTQPRRESRPVKAVELDYRHDKGARHILSPTPDNYTPAKVQDTDILAIRSNIQTLCQKVMPGALLLTAMDPPPPPPPLPNILELASNFQLQNFEGTFVDYLKYSVTDQQREISKTLIQGESTWYHAKLGRITASMAKEVLTMKLTSSAKTLVSKIMEINDVSHPNLDHGNKFEPIARQKYRDRQSKTHKGLKVSETGLHISDELPFMGASPDGLVHCSCHGQRLLEIKCSIKHQHVFPCQIPEIDPAYHLESVDNVLSLKPKSSWYSQIQYQMGVTGIHECDLVVHTLKDIGIITVPWDVIHWKKLSGKAVVVFDSKILPLLFHEA